MYDEWKKQVVQRLFHLKLLLSSNTKKMDSFQNLTTVNSNGFELWSITLEKWHSHRPMLLTFLSKITFQFPIGKYMYVYDIENTLLHWAHFQHVIL